MQEIGRHLVMSERNARDVLKGLGLDAATVTLDDCREAYIKDLREKAAGRYGDTGQSLAMAKTDEARASTDLKLLTIAEKARELVPANAVEETLRSMIVAARAELLSLPDKLRVEIQALHGVDIDADLIQTHVEHALSNLARQDHGELSPDAVEDRSSVGSAA